MCQHDESEKISHKLREDSCNTTERLVFEIYPDVLQITKKETLQINLDKKHNQTFHKKETVKKNKTKNTRICVVRSQGKANQDNLFIPIRWEKIKCLLLLSMTTVCPKNF